MKEGKRPETIPLLTSEQFSTPPTNADSQSAVVGKTCDLHIEELLN
jgi:hypothetical protein